MNALTGEIFSSSVARDQKNRLRTHVTHSGFSITVEPRAKYDPTFLAEMFFKLVGVLFIPAGGIVLFLPRLVDGPAFVATQIGLLAAFIFVGVAIHRRADRGFRRKIYVDSAKGEVRTGTLNVSENFHLLATYTVANIDSFFIVRSKDTVTPAKLKMRLKVGAQTIPLVEGSESSLVPILERITLALSPPAMRSRRYKTKPNGDFIRMTFE